MFLFQANTTSLISAADLQLIAPELILTACACVALVMEVILPYRKSKMTAYFSLVGVGLAFTSLFVQWWYMGASLPYDGFYGMVRIDGFALLFKGIFLISAALAIGISTRFLDIEGEQHGEYYALILFATVGMMFIACGYDLYQTPEEVERSSDEIFSARSLFFGCAALRYVVDLRHCRFDEHWRD
jgi:NADH-quinone oxidoreductase subunit N